MTTKYHSISLPILVSIFIAVIGMPIFAAEQEVENINTAQSKQDRPKQDLPKPDNQRDLSEDDYLGDVPKVLTVSRLSQPITDAPSAVTIIDKETIRAAGITDLPEIFRLVPGFYVASNAAFIYNSNHVVSYHGMTSAYPGHMQVLINGRSVYSPLFGGVKWSELPIAIDDIERIEITRGPNAASYGANSFFGVISIITKEPTHATGNHVKLTYGNGRKEAFYSHSGVVEDLNYHFTAGYREDDGLNNRNDFKRSRFINLQADKRLNENNEINIELGLGNGVRADGEAANDYVLFVPRLRDIDNHYEMIRWRHNISDNSDFSLQAYHSHDATDDHFISTNLRGNANRLQRERLLLRRASPAVAQAGANAFSSRLLNDQIDLNNDVKLERFDLEAQHTLSPAKNLRLVWGANVRLDTTYSPYRLGTTDTDHFNLQRLFGHAEWRINEQFLVNLGSMVEHNDFTGTDITPRASLNFKLTPNHTIRLGISTATRTPNYVEEKFNDFLLIPTKAPTPTYLVQRFANAGNLKPERILSREIGYLGQIGKLSIDARLFDDEIKDVINSVRLNLKYPPNILLLAQPSTYINDGDAQVRGFETQIKFKLSKQTQLLANYSYINIVGNKAHLPRDYVDSAASNTFSALITHQFDSNWDASFAYYQASSVTALGDGADVPLSRRSDIRVARQFNTNKVKGEASIAIENLFNNHYNEYALYNTLGRRALVNVSLDF